MSRRLGYVSERTVRNKLKRLLEKRLITLRAGAVPESLGYVIAADISIDIEAGKVLEVADALCKLSEVYYVSLISGESDISAACLATDVDSLQTFITETIHTMPGVRKTRVYLLTRTLKESYDWPFPEESDPA
jgi:Lrp/AsnC family transcriptional regulator for asnA, asnC and gidA